MNLETYYSFANIAIIREVNNSFKWSAEDGKAWTILRIPTGCYELNAEIIRIHGNSDITILPNVNTLQCILTVVGAKCKVSFDVPNSLASVLGFKQSIVYGVRRHATENLVNIMRVNSIWYIATLPILRTCVVHKLQLPIIYSQIPLLGK